MVGSIRLDPGLQTNLTKQTSESLTVWQADQARVMRQVTDAIPGAARVSVVFQQTLSIVMCAPTMSVTFASTCRVVVSLSRSKLLIQDNLGASGFISLSAKTSSPPPANFIVGGRGCVARAHIGGIVSNGSWSVAGLTAFKGCTSSHSEQRMCMKRRPLERHLMRDEQCLGLHPEGSR